MACQWSDGAVGHDGHPGGGLGEVVGDRSDHAAADDHGVAPAAQVDMNGVVTAGQGAG